MLGQFVKHRFAFGPRHHGFRIDVVRRDRIPLGTETSVVIASKVAHDFIPVNAICLLVRH